MPDQERQEFARQRSCRNQKECRSPHDRVKIITDQRIEGNGLCIHRSGRQQNGRQKRGVFPERVRSSQFAVLQKRKSKQQRQKLLNDNQCTEIPQIDRIGEKFANRLKTR